MAKKETFTIGEYVSLPSKGKLYDKELPSKITLRSMTTVEEMKRLMPSSSPYKVLCEIIDDCIIEDLGISSYDMVLGDYQYLLMKLRVITHGAKYHVNYTCPICGFQSEMQFNLDTLKILEYDESLKEHLEFTLPASNKVIKLRMQTPRMLDDVTEKVNEFKEKSKNGLTMDYAFLFTIMSLIDTVDGKKLDQVKLEDFVRGLSMADTAMIMAHSDKLNDSVGVDNNIESKCLLCKTKDYARFKFTSEFFRPRLDV